MDLVRENWLNKAVQELKDTLLTEEELPEKLKVSCGFCVKKNAIGICCPPVGSKDGYTEIFIDPQLDESCRVLDVLLHELIHAILGSGRGHGKAFKKIALRVGLLEPVTATTASAELNEKLKKIVERIGEYPHSAYIKPTKAKEESKDKEDKAMVNLRCKDECDILVKTLKSYLVKRNLTFSCPVCGDNLKNKEERYGS